jgi:hypothetical protein
MTTEQTAAQWTTFHEFNERRKFNQGVHAPHGHCKKASHHSELKPNSQLKAAKNPFTMTASIALAR